MKVILTGNEAVARGAWEAGCHVAAAYPGTPSTEILENVSTYREMYSEWSPNEKVALEVASGASMAGARAMCAMKHVGLNVAADPLFTMSYIGVNGGLVIVDADDPGLFSSQNEQDNRWYALHAKLPMLEPSDSQECLDFMKAAFDISEQFDTPVLLRLTTRICHSKGVVRTGERTERPVRAYNRNPAKNAMLPAFAKAKHYMVEKRLEEMRSFAESSPLNYIEMNEGAKIGVVANGVGFQYAMEALGDRASYLKIGFTWPFPRKLVREFAAKVETLWVVEENDPFMEQEIRAMGIPCSGKDVLPLVDELSQALVAKAVLGTEPGPGTETGIMPPNRPPLLCPGCPHRGLLFLLSGKKDVVVTGDIGCYGLGSMPPLNVGESTICMGAGFSAAIGFQKALEKAGKDRKVFGILGDSTFFHSGITGLIDAVVNKSRGVFVILDNRITAMTGQQHNPGTGVTLMGEETAALDIPKLCEACGVKSGNIHVVDPYDLKAAKKAVDLAMAADETTVIVTNRPCALIKDVQRARSDLFCTVDHEKCVVCGACLNLGCPAITKKDGRIVIDPVPCNGCGLCVQICPKQAISREGELHD
ncbi:indolepyruvate ferredoxin oxidoreductase subunit alpha [Aminivibrio sp.]|uniref:indolepyruvate ferredoxin oxidoreductase subunit alpha n=1 Tax=Aminivibrio sp. TaxID=1872489 RepID=UPI00345EB14A